MTFPDVKYPGIAGFSDAYFDRLRLAAQSVDRFQLDRAVRLLEQAYLNGVQVFACGNGHSAAIANTFVCDHVKLVQTDTSLLPRIQSLSANIPMMTALANDLSYDDVFVYQLRTAARSGDLLVTFSSSGDSENVFRAAAWARDNGVDVLAFTGFSGGRSRGLATVNLHVEGDNYGVIEDSHQTLVHILAQYLRLSRMPEDLIGQRKF